MHAVGSEVQIRRGSLADAPAAGRVMYEAVRHGAPGYTLAQRVAWQPRPNSGVAWRNRLRGQAIFLAEPAHRCPVGVMTLGPGGYIDLAFILRAWQGRGVFRALYEAIEAEARAQRMDRLTLHASLMACGPFEAMGFQVTSQEVVRMNRASLRRFAMVKAL